MDKVYLNLYVIPIDCTLNVEPSVCSVYLVGNQVKEFDWLGIVHRHVHWVDRWIRHKINLLSQINCLLAYFSDLGQLTVGHRSKEIRILSRCKYKRKFANLMLFNPSVVLTT